MTLAFPPSSGGHRPVGNVSASVIIQTRTLESEDDAINNHARTGPSGDCAGHTGIGGLWETLSQGIWVRGRWHP